MMKFLIALSLMVATASAGILPPVLEQRLPMVPMLSPMELEARITGGDEAEVGEFPYQAGLFLDFADGTAFCGGSLISDRYILTAAHCTDGAKGVTIYLGAHNVRLNNEKGQQRIYSTHFIIHEDWDPKTLSNDISLIKSPVVIAFNDRIQPILLPKKSGQYSTYEGADVVASGWGKPSDSATGISEVLRFIDTTVISRKTCARYYFGVISDFMLCITGKDGRSICSGDSGGPLAYTDNDGLTYVIGATSFGIALGCEKGFPGVFTRVTYYLDWIEEKSGVVNK